MNPVIRDSAGRTRSGLGAALLFGLVAPATVLAQDPQRSDTLPRVRVTVGRDGPRALIDLPFAISSVVPDSTRPGQRHLAADEMLFGLPGVIVANRGNPTQDPRISIRGFGARSAFGVRGIRVLRDGIPLTVADGQTPIDYLDLESVGRIDVVRGAAASLYGSSSGGVVDVHSADPPLGALAGRLSRQGGSFGLERWSASSGGRSGPFRYQGDVSRSEQEGYRRHASQSGTGGSARVVYDRADSEVALLFTGLHVPTSENPGALTRAQFLADPRQADQQQILRATRKAVRQTQLGLTALRQRGDAEVSAVLHGGWRTLDNPLTFAIVDVDRTTYGGALRGTVPMALLGLTHRISAGIDAQLQDDDRLNFQNCNNPRPPTTPTVLCPSAGNERGVVRLDQREEVRNVGAFLRDEIELTSRIRATLGVRADDVRFRVDDHFTNAQDPDDSGERTLRALSPTVAIVARIGALSAVHASLSSGFETPTATELANKPDGSAGLNPALDPQYATTAEIGFTGFLLQRVRYDVALFDTRTRDELIPFETTNGSGRRFFRNAGKTRRRGAEAGLAAVLGPLDIGAAYTYSDFTFTDYRVLGTDFSGRRIPGLPVQQLQAHATLRAGSAFLGMDAASAGRVIANDANTVSAPGYELVNLRAGLLGIGSAPRLDLILGVNNVFGRRYVGAVVVNAAAQRYYEPAPGRTVYGGLTVALGR